MSWSFPVERGSEIYIAYQIARDPLNNKTITLKPAHFHHTSKAAAKD